MSNLANYSPYNKTYKFILFQNQAYHERNKRNASPLVRTNLRHSMSRISSSTKNPQNLQFILWNLQSPRHSVSPHSKTGRSKMFDKKRQIQSAKIQEQKRVIHKNQSYEKFRNKQVVQENLGMASRIIRTSCQVITKDTTQKSFQRHIRYQNIRRRYNQAGQRKDCISLGINDFCPTLMEFQKAGLGQKFVEKDLSMSIKPSTSQSMRRSYFSNCVS